MSPEGGRAPSLLCLIVIAAGLNIYSISSANTTEAITSPVTLSFTTPLIPTEKNTTPWSTPNGTFTTPLIPTEKNTTPWSTPNGTFTTPLIPTEKNTTPWSTPNGTFTTPLIPTEKNTTPWSTPNGISNTSEMTVSTTNFLSQPRVGLQSTKQMSTLVMPVDTSATTNVSHAETVATPTSGVTNVSSISSSSLAPEGYTSSWVTHLSSTEVTTVPMTSKEHTVERTSPEVTTKQSSSEGKTTYSQETSANKTTVETVPIGSTISPKATMQEVQQGLSSGSIAAITITVIAVVLLVFGIAAYLKIRHSSYGRLFDDRDYGSWENYNNPVYDDS